MLAILVPAIMATILMNSVFSQEGSRIPIAVVDEDNTAFSKFVVDRIKENMALKVNIINQKTAEEMVSSNRLEVAFIISRGFEKKIKQGEYSDLIKMIKNPKSISAEMIGEGIASSAVKLFCASMASNKVVAEYSKLSKITFEEKNKLWNETWKQIEQQWNQPEPIMKIDISRVNANTTKNIGSNIDGSRIILGVISAFLMFFLLMGAWWLSEEERNGTIFRIKVSTISPLAIIAGNMLFLYVVGIIQSLLYLLFFRLILNISIPVTFDLFVSLTSYIFLISAIVFILSAYFTPIQLGIIIPIISLFTALAGGCFWDITMFDSVIQKISLLTPQGLLLKIFDSPEQAIAINLFFLLAGTILLWISYIRLKTKERIL